MIFSKKICFFLLLMFISMIVFFKYFFYFPKNNSNAFQYMEEIENIDVKNINQLKIVEDFIQNHKNIYGTLASMTLAKKYITNNKLQEAYNALHHSLDYTDEENLRNLILLRIVKIEIELGKYQEAKNILQNMKNDVWMNIVENLQGDIAFQEHDVKKALYHWKKSLTDRNSDAFQEIIQLKISEYQRNIE